MSTQTQSESLLYTTFSLGGAPKGSVLSNDGATAYVVTTPTADNQVVVSDAAVPGGVVLQSAGGGGGAGSPGYNAFGNRMVVPTVGQIRYGLSAWDGTNTGGAVPIGLPFPACTLTYLGATAEEDFGWTGNPTPVHTSGGLYFTVGRVAPGVQQTAGNWVPYPGGPHGTITFTQLNTAGSFTLSNILSVPIGAGDIVSLRMENDLTATSDMRFGYTMTTFTFSP